MNYGKRTSLITVVAAIITCLVTLLTPAILPVPVAHADTYSELVGAQNSKQASAEREAQLRSQLSGVKSDLADQIVALDDLTNNQIPAAQSKVKTANAAAAAAKSEAADAADRLDAAKQDKANLEEQIKQTGEDYDDAHAAVAQVARDSMHGSTTSDVMSVVTGSTDTKEFIQSMQSRDALSRNEANAASDAADELSTSMNRSDRLKAIEERITKLKVDADEKSAAAQSAATSAQKERDQLDQLRVKGEKQRSALEGRMNELSDAAAQQAAQTVMLQSQIDGLNRQYAEEQAAEAARVQQMVPQGTTEPVANNTTTTEEPVTTQQPTQTTQQPAQTQQPTQTQQPAQTQQPTQTQQPVQTPTQQPTQTTTTPTQPSASSGGSSTGQGTSNGDYGNAYAAGQCTAWAYQRRKEMGIGTPSYLGNGGEWYITAPSYGLRVDHTPQVGAALSFLPGQEGASVPWGHVAVVEAVYGDSIMISEWNVQGLFVTSYRTLSNPSRFWYVH